MIRNTTRWLKGLGAIVISMMGVSSFSCDSSTNGDPQPAATHVLQSQLSPPKSGQSHAYTDSLAIFTQANLDSFNGQISIEYSLDSGKTPWNSIIDLMAQSESSIAYDTIYWSAKDEMGYNKEDFLNRGILIRVRDYQNQFFAKSDFFTIHE
jgi:hypothetical protein